MSDEMRMMQPSPHGKHFKAEKIAGFWDVVQKFPPPNYEARHRLDNDVPRRGQTVYMGCRLCVESLSEPPVKI